MEPVPSAHALEKPPVSHPGPRDRAEVTQDVQQHRIGYTQEPMRKQDPPHEPLPAFSPAAHSRRAPSASHDPTAGRSPGFTCLSTSPGQAPPDSSLSRPPRHVGSVPPQDKATGPHPESRGDGPGIR